MKIKKEKLLIVAGAVWALAGINILRIGITSYLQGSFLYWMPFVSALILFCFLWMFKRVVRKNTNRILSYSETVSVFAFLDAKGYLLMAFMMGLGITLRAIDLLPTAFFAVFYTGLGTALTLAGVLFIRNYFKARTSL